MKRLLTLLKLCTIAIKSVFAKSSVVNLATNVEGSYDDVS